MRFEYLNHHNREWGRRDPHLAMQVHIDCHRDYCETRDAAVQALIDAKKLIPDSNRSHA